ncbi:hypothetical protein [Actinomadura gamaensis]|uniref:Uncharacterized protein n=1 Tax=Actinomadura gamaensis TaxID=1763541 RepID=A0ABV9UF70_9ACTN
MDRGEVGAVVVLLEGLAAQHPDDPLSVLAVRVAAALRGRAAAGEAEAPPDAGLSPDRDQVLGRDFGAVAAAERRREVGQVRDLAAEGRDAAAEDRDARAAVRAARAVESALTAEATAARMSDLLRLAELRDDRAAEQSVERRTSKEQRRTAEEDRASNRVDRAALRAFLLTLQVDRLNERHARRSNAQNRFAAGRDRAAAKTDRQVSEGDRDQTLIDVEELAQRLHWTRQNIINIINLIERAEHLNLSAQKIEADPVVLGELEAIAREASQYRK